jgi:hypothetical protein
LGRDLATRRLDHLHRWPRLPGRRLTRTHPAGSSQSGRAGEVEASERLRITVKEFWRLAPNDTVERRDALLAIKQKFDDAWCQRGVTASIGLFTFGEPHQQAADGVLAVKGFHQPPDLVAVPDVATLEFGQSHTAQIDLIDDDTDFHILFSPSGIVVSRRISAMSSAVAGSRLPITISARQ